MKVNVINPIDKAITVSIEGKTYSVEAKGTIEVEEGHAEYWKTKLHNFLFIEEIGVKEEAKTEPKENKKDDEANKAAEAKKLAEEAKKKEDAKKAEEDKKKEDANKDK